MKKPLRIALICVAATVVTAGLVLAGIVGVQRYRASQIPVGDMSTIYVYINDTYYTMGEYSSMHLPEGFVQTGVVERTRGNLSKEPLQNGDGIGVSVGDIIFTSQQDPDTVYVLTRFFTEGSPRYMRFDKWVQRPVE